jgi:sulfur carrier protein ThiS
MLPPVEERTGALVASSAELEVRVALHADLRKYFDRGQVGPKSMRLAHGSTVTDLFDILRINDRDDVTVAINGELARHTALLHDRDEITMFSPMEGG